MTAPLRDPDVQPREAELGGAEFRRIAAVVHRAAGIVLADSKRPLVHSRLSRRLRALGLAGFAEYCTLLEGPGGEAEREELILAITTNVTAFFREKHHFELLAERLLPDLVARARAGGRVRLWSAACSSGEEPYSLALTVLGACPEAARLDIRILATDIDRNVLARAEAGTYPAQVRASVPEPLARKYLREAGPEKVGLADEARALISFRRLNLLETWPVRGPFDVVFCRNVVIYFDRPTQETLWQRFDAVLPDGAHIMIGHSERVAGPAAARMRPVGITTYQKRGA